MNIRQKPSPSNAPIEYSPKTQSLTKVRLRPEMQCAPVQKPSPSACAPVQKPSRSKTQSQWDWVFGPAQSRDWVFGPHSILFKFSSVLGPSALAPPSPHPASPAACDAGRNRPRMSAVDRIYERSGSSGMLKVEYSWEYRW